jgi:hypothetical protein
VALQKNNIGSWTYSLKSGKKLTVYDVAQGAKQVLRRNWSKGLKSLVLVMSTSSQPT